jgi:hypothetical protein
VRAGPFKWVFFLGLLGAVWPAPTGVGVPRQVAFASASPSSSAEEPWKLRPIKKRVGRAVTPTMDKVDNIWFVVSQIVSPLSAIIFSLMYVRRYKARHAIASGCPGTHDSGEAVENEQPASPVSGSG